MTTHKHLKQLIRSRMEKTGERYTTARRHIIRALAPSQTEQSQPDPATRWHMPGNIPATTALRVLLTHAGVRAPHTQSPFSEAMLFGIAGGIGIGVFSFYYEKEDVATFYLGGRHHWYDDLLYLKQALASLGVEPVIQETGGARAATQQLRDMLGQYGACIAWVDMAMLPHRGMDDEMKGGSYHVVTVYKVNQDEGVALIGDLTDDPMTISLDDLTQARLRIKKQANRLLAIPPTQVQPDLETLVQAGLRQCHEGLLHPAIPGSPTNARLGALRTWADRLTNVKDKESWERNFRPGPNLWRGLCAIYYFIENYGTGGGLCRPLFADFLTEAGGALSNPTLTALGEQYAELGRQWSALADAALPDSVPSMRQAKILYGRLGELLHAGAAADEVRAVWQALNDLEKQSRTEFPLSDTEAADLRADLARRVLALYEGEVAAHAALPTAMP